MLNKLENTNNVKSQTFFLAANRTFPTPVLQSEQLFS